MITLNKVCSENYSGFIRPFEARLSATLFLSRKT